VHSTNPVDPNLEQRRCLSMINNYRAEHAAKRMVSFDILMKVAFLSRKMRTNVSTTGDITVVP